MYIHMKLKLMVTSTRWISPMLLGWEQPTMQLYRKMTSNPQIFTTRKKKHDKGSPYIVLIIGDIAFKDCMSSLRYVHKTTWHFYRAFGANLSFLPPLDILIVNALEQKTFSKAVWSKQNTFFTPLPPFPRKQYWKIVNNKHSYHEYILPISLADSAQAVFFFFFKNNFFLKTSLEILLQRCQNSYH